MDTAKLKKYLERIANLEHEKTELNRDIKQVYVEAQNDGVKVVELKMAVKLSKMKHREREALDAVKDVVD